MAKRMRILFPLLILFICVCGIRSGTQINAYAAERQEWQSGECTVEFDGIDTIFLSPSDPQNNRSVFAEYTESQAKPWDSCSADIKHIIINPGVSYLGSYTFNHLYNLVDIKFADGCSAHVELGYGVFKNCSNLAEIDTGYGYMYQLNNNIKNTVFNGCTSLKTVLSRNYPYINYLTDSSLQNLETLSIYWNGSDTEDFIKKCRNLKNLWVSRVTNNGYENLKETLKYLSDNGCEIHLAAVEEIPCDIPNCDVTSIIYDSVNDGRLFYTDEAVNIKFNEHAFDNIPKDDMQLYTDGYHEITDYDIAGNTISFNSNLIDLKKTTNFYIRCKEFFIWYKDILKNSDYYIFKVVDHEQTYDITGIDEDLTIVFRTNPVYNEVYFKDEILNKYISSQEYDPDTSNVTVTIKKELFKVQNGLNTFDYTFRQYDKESDSYRDSYTVKFKDSTDYAPKLLGDDRIYFNSMEEVDDVTLQITASDKYHNFNFTGLSSYTEGQTVDNGADYEISYDGETGVSTIFIPKNIVKSKIFNNSAGVITVFAEIKRPEGTRSTAITFICDIDYTHKVIGEYIDYHETPGDYNVLSNGRTYHLFTNLDLSKVDSMHDRFNDADVFSRASRFYFDKNGIMTIQQSPVSKPKMEIKIQFIDGSIRKILVDSIADYGTEHKCTWSNQNIFDCKALNYIDLPFYYWKQYNTPAPYNIYKIVMDNVDITDYVGYDGNTTNLRFTKNVFNRFPDGEYTLTAIATTGNACSAKIKVINSPAKVISGLHVESVTEQYLLNQPFDNKGKLIVTYSDYTTEELSLASATVKGFDSSTLGTKTVTVNYMGHEASFSIDVIKSVKSISLIGETTAYNLGDEFDGNGTLSVVYEDDTTDKINLTKCMLEGFDTSTAGIKAVTVKYANATCNYKIYVSGTPLPPVVLDTIVYEFYKDYPDYVVMPVKLNSATGITHIKIGSNLLSKSDYGLADSRITIPPDVLSAYEAGKYYVTIQFNDLQKTIVSNIVIHVYEAAADRVAPYLLQSIIDFSGQTLRLPFDHGYGSLKTNHVLALVLDDDLILPDGRTLPFTGSNVKQLQKARTFAEDSDGTIEEIIDEEEFKIATDSNARWAREATSSNAAPDKRLKKTDKRIAGIAANTVVKMADIDMGAGNVFYVDGNEIVWDGGYITGLGLDAGDHFVGAIFDNTEKTTDVRKVILRIADKDDGPESPDDGDTDSGIEDDKKDPGTEKDPSDTEKDPSVPGDDLTNETDPDKNQGNKPGADTDSDNKPSGGNTGIISGGNSRPSGGSSGGSSGGGSRPSSGGSSSNGHGPGSTANGSGSGSAILPDGSMNAEFKPAVPETPGSWEGSGQDWQFKKADGTYAKGEWIGSNGDWYYISADGKMKFDWFLDENGKWYMLNKDEGARFGAALYGWYFEKQDGKWYFMNPSDTAMLVGWQFINGKWYYLTQHNDAPTYVGDNINGWIYNGKSKPCGSMYVNEVTPDGYQVGSDGAWIK